MRLSYSPVRTQAEHRSLYLEHRLADWALVHPHKEAIGRKPYSPTSLSDDTTRRGTVKPKASAGPP